MPGFPSSRLVSILWSRFEVQVACVTDLVEDVFVWQDGLDAGPDFLVMLSMGKGLGWFGGYGREPLGLRLRMLQAAADTCIS